MPRGQRPSPEDKIHELSARKDKAIAIQKRLGYPRSRRQSISSISAGLNSAEQSGAQVLGTLVSVAAFPASGKTPMKMDG